jgi:hypothetical protein
MSDETRKIVFCLKCLGNRFIGVSHILETSLNQLGEGLESKYISFLLEYTSHCIHNRSTLSDITAVALALVEEETLTYDMVLEIMEQNRINPVLK